jgi:hypothetical protein
MESTAYIQSPLNARFMKTILLKVGKAIQNSLTILITLMLSLYTTVTVAQNKWSIAVRPGVHFPTKDLGPASLKTGFGIEGSVAYRFMPHFAAYAGWGWNSFADKRASSELEFEETGYIFGLQFIHPFPESNIKYMLRGGGIYTHIETENSSGDIIGDTGHGLGWEIETGVAIPIGQRFHLTPGVRFRSLQRKMEFGEIKTPVDLQTISVGVTASWSFGK